MENRKPFELRKVLIVYNFLQVLFSTWLFYEACTAGWFAGYSFRCQPVDYSRSAQAMRVSERHSWIYQGGSINRTGKVKDMPITRSVQNYLIKSLLTSFGLIFNFPQQSQHSMTRRRKDNASKCVLSRLALAWPLTQINRQADCCEVVQKNMKMF